MSRADNAMTRNDDRQWIAGACGTYRPGTGVEVLGYVAVGRSGTIWDPSKMPPNLLLEWSAGGPDRKVESEKRSVEIGVQLRAGVLQKGSAGIIKSPAPFDGDESVTGLEEREVADRGAERKMGHGASV